MVDSRYTPLKSLMQYIEGSSWIVSYYSQILDQDNENSPQQIDRNPIYQQYLLIHELEMKVQQPLTVTQNQESKEMEVTGSAMLYPGLIPNKGDMFLADVGDGRAGIFTITTVEKKSLLKDTTYRIDYVLKNYTSPEILADLQRKTIREAYFVKDYLKFGQNPQVLAPEYEDLLSLRDLYQTLIGQYFSDFYSNDFETLIVPDQTFPTYDPFLTKAILDWVTTDEHPYVQRIRRLNVYSEAIMRSPTVWDALTKMSKAILPTAARVMGTVDTRVFFSAAEYGGVYYSGIQRVVYPFDGRTDADRGHSPESLKSGTQLSSGRHRWRDLQRRILVTDLPGLAYMPVPDEDLANVTAITELDTYLFSSNFYKNKQPYGSRIEKLAVDAINGKSLNVQLLKQVSENVEHWQSLERFYYVPVLIALLKVKIRTN
jgi:hypothetical protein